MLFFFVDHDTDGEELLRSSAKKKKTTKKPRRASWHFPVLNYSLATRLGKKRDVFLDTHTSSTRRALHTPASGGTDKAPHRVSDYSDLGRGSPKRNPALSSRRARGRWPSLAEKTGRRCRCPCRACSEAKERGLLVRFRQPRTSSAHRGSAEVKFSIHIMF